MAVRTRSVEAVFITFINRFHPKEKNDGLRLHFAALWLLKICADTIFDPTGI